MTNKAFEVQGDSYKTFVVDGQNSQIDLRDGAAKVTTSADVEFKVGDTTTTINTDGDVILQRKLTFVTESAGPSGMIVVADSGQNFDVCSTQRQ